MRKKWLAVGVSFNYRLVGDLGVQRLVRNRRQLLS